MDNSNSTLPCPNAPCYPELRDRVALVTGGGAGIGKGISLRLAAEGMRVCLCGRTEAHLKGTAELIRRKGGTAIPIVTDLTEPRAIAQLSPRAAFI